MWDNWLNVCFCIISPALSVPTISQITVFDIWQTLQDNDEIVKCLLHFFINFLHQALSNECKTCTFLRPSLKALTHLFTIPSHLIFSPYTSEIWRGRFLEFMLPACYQVISVAFHMMLVTYIPDKISLRYTGISLGK